MTIQESDKIVVQTDLKTLGGADFRIENDPQGYYVLRATGEGRHPLADERFTSLFEARKRINEYQIEHQFRLANKARYRQNRKDYEKAVADGTQSG